MSVLMADDTMSLTELLQDLTSVYPDNDEYPGCSSSTKKLSVEERVIEAPLRSVVQLDSSSPFHIDTICRKWRPTMDATTISRKGTEKEVKDLFSYDAATPHTAITFYNEIEASDFHSRYILDPARKAATLVMNRQPSLQSPKPSIRFVRHAVTTWVIPDFTVIHEDKVLLTIEDKLESVLTTHKRTQIETFRGDFPAYTFTQIADIQNSGGTTTGLPPWQRILVQVYTQMAANKISVGMLWSPRHTMFFRREGDVLYKASRLIPNDKDEIVRNSAYILEALNSPVTALPSRSCSEYFLAPINSITSRLYATIGLYFCYRVVFLLDGLISVTAIRHDELGLGFVTLVFEEYIGSGSAGHVYRSRSCGLVVKVYNDEKDAKSEFDLLCLASSIQTNPVPRVRGLFLRYGLGFVVMDDGGNSIESLENLDAHQICQLAQCIKDIHAAHIHHHDLRPANIVVDAARRVRLVDFHMGARVEACHDCEDMEFLDMLQTCY